MGLRQSQLVTRFKIKLISAACGYVKRYVTKYLLLSTYKDRCQRAIYRRYGTLNMGTDLLGMYCTYLSVCLEGESILSCGLSQLGV